MTIPRGLAARAVIETNTRKSKMVIEVKEGTRFTNFYLIYNIVGLGRHRTITPGLSRHRGFADSLEDTVGQIVAAIRAHAKRQKMDLAVHTTIRIYRKRLYRKLLNMRPDELGLAHTRFQPDPRLVHAELLKVENSPLPIAYTPIAKRWKIISRER